jgi:hypothetical protein
VHNALVRNATISAVLLTALCSAAYAGSNNQITIEQTGFGNNLTVDQSKATGRVVGGASLGSGNTLSLTPTARQTGSGNTANLTIEDADGVSGGRIGLLQNNVSQTTAGVGANNAAVSVLGGGLGLVSQIGGANVANLSVRGLDATGTVNQRGHRNNAGLTVSGAGANGVIEQIGNDNALDLQVSGAGTSASYTLIGNNISNTTAGGGGVQVISNGATVTITQTPF